MKITVELRDEDRSKLLQMAADQPDKGLTLIVSEALDLFLRTRERSQLRNEKTASLRGSITAEQAAAFRQTLTKIRSSWR